MVGYHDGTKRRPIIKPDTVDKETKILFIVHIPTKYTNLDSFSTHN